MREMANTVQAVINTMEQLDIKSTYDNTNKLLGCFQALSTVRDNLNKIADVQEEALKKESHFREAAIEEIGKVEGEQNVAAIDPE